MDVRPPQPISSPRRNMTMMVMKEENWNKLGTFSWLWTSYAINPPFLFLVIMAFEFDAIMFNLVSLPCSTMLPPLSSSAVCS